MFDFVFLEWQFSLFMLFLFLVIGLTMFLTRGNKQNRNGEPFGIGGWLVLPIIGFTGIAIGGLQGLYQNYIDYFDYYILIFFGDDAKLNAMQLPEFVSIIFDIAVISTAAICIFKIFYSKDHLRKIAIVHYVILAGSGISAYVLGYVELLIFPQAERDPQQLRHVVRGLAFASLGIPYFLFSKRIQNTFETKPAGFQQPGLAK